MIYQNYEKSQHVFDFGDKIAVRIASRVHSFIISDEMRYSERLRPSKPFDMCYFYFSLARAVGAFFGKNIHTGLETDYEVLAFNRPNLRQEAWRGFPFAELGLASLYMTQVADDSRAGGVEFDLGFACAVACRSLDSRIFDDIREGALNLQERGGDDFDSWLEGFSA